MPVGKQVLIFEEADGSATVTNVKSAAFLSGQFKNLTNTLIVQTQNGGATPPTLPLIDVLVEESPDKVNWTAVATWAITQITAVGVQLAKFDQPAGVALFLRVDTTIAYTAQLDGTTVKVWFGGEIA